MIFNCCKYGIIFCMIWIARTAQSHLDRSAFLVTLIHFNVFLLIFKTLFRKSVELSAFHDISALQISLLTLTPNTSGSLQFICVHNGPVLLFFAVLSVYFWLGPIEVFRISGPTHLTHSRILFAAALKWSSPLKFLNSTHYLITK